MEEDIRTLLWRDRLIERRDAEITPLTGGVSSEIYRVRDGARVFAVKRALAKLKVADEWFADLSRNATEVKYLRCVERLVPGVVPRVEFASAKDGYFAMEFLGEGFHNWKTLLLDGVCKPEQAIRAARVLAEIHGGTWDNPKIRNQFETTDNFRQLRTDPYLLTTGKRHPDLESHFVKEVERIESTRRCLVHGDYSPKNLLFSEDRLVVLDCEVAWFGDPTFDVAFLLNHFFLKSLHRPERREDFFKMIDAGWSAYRDELGVRRSPCIAAPLPRLILMLMLARVDGKSPVEYLRDNEPKKNLIRRFARDGIVAPPADLSALVSAWNGALHSLDEN